MFRENEERARPEGAGKPEGKGKGKASKKLKNFKGTVATLDGSTLQVMGDFVGRDKDESGEFLKDFNVDELALVLVEQEDGSEVLGTLGDLDLDEAVMVKSDLEGDAIQITVLFEEVEEEEEEVEEPTDPATL